MIQFQCSCCQIRLEANETDAGQWSQCPARGIQILIPFSSQLPTDLSASYQLVEGQGYQHPYGPPTLPRPWDPAVIVRTREDWEEAEDLRSLIDFVSEGYSARKHRLTAVACARLVEPFLSDPAPRAAIQAARLFADHRISEQKMIEAEINAWSVWMSSGGGEFDRAARATAVEDPVESMHLAGMAALSALQDNYREEQFRTWVENGLETWLQKGRESDPTQQRQLLQEKMKLEDSWSRTASAQAEAQVLQVLFDQYGNPFQKIGFSAEFLATSVSSVVKLAEAIYEVDQFDALPILGDALEEAGCTDQSILYHCRHSGPHAHGCYVLDAILGLEE